MEKWNGLIFLAVAIINGYTAWAVNRAHAIAAQTMSDVHHIEKATNSMKDALVAATDKAARSEGMAAGRAQEKSIGDQKAAQVAQGVASMVISKSTPPPLPAHVGGVSQPLHEV